MPKENAYVKVVRTETGEVEVSMGPMTEPKAETVRRGLLSSVDATKYTVVVEGGAK